MLLRLQEATGPASRCFAAAETFFSAATAAVPFCDRDNSATVSYTHLDVYKRQVHSHPMGALYEHRVAFPDYLMCSFHKIL